MLEGTSALEYQCVQLSFLGKEKFPSVLRNVIWYVVSSRIIPVGDKKKRELGLGLEKGSQADYRG